MELHTVPRRSYVRVLDKETKIPPGSLDINQNDILFFDHVDGMYSFCKDPGGNIVHLIAWAEVEILEETDEIRNLFDQ